MAGRPIKVMVAKPGLDGHDRGVKVVARALRDAGMEVVYTGLFQTPEEIVEAAMEEDVDVLGLSILSGAHMTLVPRVIELLKENDATDIYLVVGGTIVVKEEIAELKAMGVPVIFGPETPLQTIVKFLQENVKVA